MTVASRTMTREQRVSIARQYFGRLDSGGDVLERFADDATARFPKWGIGRGKTEIARMVGDVATLIAACATTTRSSRSSPKATWSLSRARRTV
jgi:hypothetical protein